MHCLYMDPPYIGQAKKHYQADELDHYLLLQWANAWYPDGWALSCSSVSLPEITRYCNQLGIEDIRIGAWVKPFASFKPGVNPGYTWEPLIWRGGRTKRARNEPTVRDYISANITLRKGLSGVKPDAFCYWLFDILGLQPGDRLDDLFPGSGAVTRCWVQRQSEWGYSLSASSSSSWSNSATTG